MISYLYPLYISIYIILNFKLCTIFICTKKSTNISNNNNTIVFDTIPYVYTSV